MSADLAFVTALAQRARAASLVLATAPTATKNTALTHLASLLDASHPALLAANTRDLATPEVAALDPAARERLTLTPAKLTHLANSVREVIALPDPIGEILDDRTRPNGLRIRQVRVPIGVIAIIYESRPNVTVDCAILCLKSGNAAILRGGSECFHTNTALAGLIQQALTAAGLPAASVQLIPTTDRAALTHLLTLDTLIHCIIPRGGKGLIRHVVDHTTIPVIKHYTGVCFVYVDKDADPAMAENIVINAKVSRPGVCNAAEQLIIHADVAETLLPRLAAALHKNGVQLRAEGKAHEILQHYEIEHQKIFDSFLRIRPLGDRKALIVAQPDDLKAEFLKLTMGIRLVATLDEAIATINRDSSAHTDAIVTRDPAAAARFQASVDSAVVLWNASTRFNDGFEFGFGAEIGISTDRLHARGPMGLRELCSYKYLVTGTGQVRG